MAPTWIPLCTTMQIYCEPYFTAVERWRNYSNHQLLTNRISLIEIADRIFTEYSQKKEETFEFDIVADNPDAELLPETLPSVGKTYVIGGDKLAFTAAKSLVPEHLFNRIGLFFQNFLLKQIAGHSDPYLEKSNPLTHQSIIQAVEKLFLLPEEAGKARFIYRPLQADGTYGEFRNFASSPMGETATLFAEYLITTQNL
eukprot:gene5414-5810_t